jgi:hypothetical protein
MLPRLLITWCAYACLGLNTYLFVHRLFNDTFKGSDCIVRSEGTINKETIRKDMEGISFGLTWGTIPAFLSTQSG